MLKLLLVLIGFFAVVLTYGADHVSLLDTFLVGYSLSELVGTSVERRANGLLSGMKPLLRPVS